MSLVFPIGGAGGIELVTQEVTYSSRASLRVRSNPDYPVTSPASVELSGEASLASYLGADLKGELTQKARGSVNPGFLAFASALASEGLGLVTLDNSSGSMELLEESPRSRSLGVMEIREDASQKYGAKASIETRNKTEEPALASIRARAQSLARARGSINVTELKNRISLLTLEIGEILDRTAKASLVTGGGVTGKALSSLEVEELSGIEVIIDLLDDIITQGAGDC